jgi:uncharacterized protein YeaO (DUF488 family)
MKADIRIKRAYESPASDDGARVLVDRIWPRGVTKEAAALALWLKDIAPTTSLRKWFGHDPARWAEFQRRYHAELADLAKAGRVTLIYGAHDTMHNQALALADYIAAHKER